MVTALSSVQVAPVQVVVNAPGRKISCSARGEDVNPSPLIVISPVFIPWLLIPETKAVLAGGPEAPHPKLSVSTKVVVPAGMGVVQATGICASEPPRQTSQPLAPGGRAGRVTVTV